jgi:hypothetical protein
VSGKIFNSNGVHVAVVNDGGVFDLDGRKLYDLKESTSIDCPVSWSDT